MATLERRSPALDIAPLILRAGLAIVFVAHGSQKLFGAFNGGGISGTGQYFASLGMQPCTLWAVVGGLVEFAGGLAVGLGLLTRVAAVALALDMVGAVVLTNWDNGFFAEKAAGGWEINLVLFCMAFALVLDGAGRHSADARLRTWFGKWRATRWFFA